MALPGSFCRFSKQMFVMFVFGRLGWYSGCFQVCRGSVWLKVVIIIIRILFISSRMISKNKQNNPNSEKNSNHNNNAGNLDAFRLFRSACCLDTDGKTSVLKEIRD